MINDLRAEYAKCVFDFKRRTDLNIFSSENHNKWHFYTIDMVFYSTNVCYLFCDISKDKFFVDELCKLL